MLRYKINSFLAIMLVFGIALITGCTDDSNQLVEREYNLVWQDEFNGIEGTIADATKWNYETGTDWGNFQLEYSTDLPKNASLNGNGKLAITAYKESYAGRAFTSARLSTKGLFDHQYGRIEASIKVPYGPGIWPAFWMLGSNQDEVGWPQCGEIDIMEAKGNQPHLIHGSLHGPGYSKENPVTKIYGIPNQRFDTDYHIYAVEWDENYIDYFVDDVLYQRITPEDASGEWVFDDSFYIILNVAVGGNFVGFPTDDTAFPQTMLVDYVRVYDEVK